MEMMGPEGRPVAALFTAQPRIEEVFGLGRTAIAFRGDVILTIVARRGAFLNPGLPYAVYWSPRTIDRMLNGPGSATSA